LALIPPGSIFCIHPCKGESEKQNPHPIREEVFAVVRCPKCATEVDVDEDEVEEGEILACPECETEMEVVQIHPVKVNAISEDDDEEEEDEESDDDDDLEDDEEEDEEEDEE
jgi:alpha-aminoadipate/glutamate carrier protein LysW